MLTFSANLGFLWADRRLPDAIRAASAAGFDAVECHWPYDIPPAEVCAALADTGLQMVSINTRPGSLDAGDFGLAAVPGREAEAAAAAREAIEYAAALDAASVHVMAGLGAGPAAHRAFVEHLAFAADEAARHDVAILIEPLCRHDADGYFLRTTDQAAAVIAEVGRANVGLLFDCYHVGRTEGDVSTRLEALRDIIGHIQIAAVPDRGAPDHGELDYGHVFDVLEGLEWDRPIGAEYRPGGDTEGSLGWLADARSRA